jgi:uncharacterized coiled-coil protein SlyX
VAQDWQDERIAELERALADRDAQLAAKDARIAELEQRVAELSRQLAEVLGKLGQNSRNFAPAAVERSAGYPWSASGQGQDFRHSPFPGFACR